MRPFLVALIFFADDASAFLIAGAMLGRNSLRSPMAPLPCIMCGTAAPDAAEQVNRLSPVALAYLGDSVFELAARERYLWPPSKVNALSSRVQRVVCAEGQHALLARVVAEFGLTEDEEDWLRRGRNASARGPRRLDPKIYRASTSIECLIGYLHLTDRARCTALLEFCMERSSDIADPPPADSGDG